jgi:hypothetical protein
MRKRRAASAVPHRTAPAEEAREDLVQAILGVLERSFTTLGPTGPTVRLAEFFRALDDVTLRAIAYRHGVYEGEAEPEPERENDVQT